LYNKRYLFENNKAYLKIEFIFECVFFFIVHTIRNRKCMWRSCFCRMKMKWLYF